MKKYLLIIISFVLFSCSKDYAQLSTDSILTLKQCVDIALTNNLQIKQSELQTQTDYINLKQSRNNRIPQVLANVSHGVNQGRSIDPFTNSYVNQNIGYGNYDLSGDIILSNGGQIKNSIKQNLFSHEASQMDLQQIKENTTLSVILAYLQILDNEDLVQQSKNQYALTQKQVDRLEILNKEGAIIPAQLYELKGQLANDQLAVIDNENALDAATLILCQLMNVPYKKINTERIDATDNAPFTDNSPADILKYLYKNSPQCKPQHFDAKAGKLR